MKRTVMKLAALLMGSVMILTSFTGCSGKPAADSNELNLYIWSEYIPENVISDFEKETGVKVNVTYYASMDEMMAKLQTGAYKEYDLIQPYSSEVEALIAQDFIQEINYDNVPNMKYISTDFLKQDYDPEQKYTVPYVYGIDYVCYNTETCPIQISSFSDLADPALKDQIVCITSTREIMGMALDSLGFDPNTTDESQIAQAGELLNSIKGNIKVFDGDAPKKELLNGECSVAITYSQDFALAQQEAGEKFQIADIESGYPQVVSQFCETKGAKNAVNAEKFINYIQDPKVMASILDTYPNGDCNTEAGSYTSEMYNKYSGTNVSDEMYNKLWRLVDVGEATTIYDKYWSDFMNE